MDRRRFDQQPPGDRSMEPGRHRRRRRRAMGQTPTSSSASSSHAANLRPAGTATRARQSILYSGRLSRSSGSQEEKLNKLLDEENAGKVSGSVDLPEFKTLALNDTRPEPEITDRVEENAGKTFVALGPRNVLMMPPKVRLILKLLRRRNLQMNQILGTHSCYLIVFKAQEYCEILKYLAEHRYTDVVEAMIAASHGFSNPAQHKLDAQAFWSSGEEFKFPEVSKSFASPTENSVQGEPSTKEIVGNAKKWMGEEVMVAFEMYIKGKDQFKDVEYGLDELQHQCFSVESHDHVFHHFNFTVKMRKPDSDWSSTPYFAQVKEIYGKKHYTCYKLSSYDDGHCYACINQGMLAVKHPIGEFGYENGQPDTGSSFSYLSDDE